MGNTILTLEWDGNGPAHSGQCTMRRTGKGFVVEDGRRIQQQMPGGEQNARGTTIGWD